MQSLMPLPARPKTWFTSDTHFFHGKMAEHRGFATREVMNDALIDTWNRRVPEGATVYHLGDLSFSGQDATGAILRDLRGKIRIVPGNHDNPKALLRMQEKGLLEILPPLFELKLGIGQPDGTTDVLRLTLCHFPMLVWNRAHYGAFHLHGHSHGTCRYPDNNRRMDVGVDASYDGDGFQAHPFGGPISIETVRAFMATRGYGAVDQHVGEEE